MYQLKLAQKKCYTRAFFLAFFVMHLRRRKLSCTINNKFVLIKCLESTYLLLMLEPGASTKTNTALIINIAKI